MLKLILIPFFTIIFTYPVFGYTIVIQEKLIGFLNKTSVITNVESFEIYNNYIHVEIKEQGKVYPYSFPCSDVVRITEDNGKNIPFNCDDSKSGTSHQKGKSIIEKQEKREIAVLNQDNRSIKSSQIKDMMIQEGSSLRMDLTQHNIKVEDDIVIIEVNCRRTNIQSILIKSYWLCGYAMDQNNLFFPEIRVILTIQKKGKEQLITVASGKDVIDIGRHKSLKHFSISKFLEKLDVYQAM